MTSAREQRIGREAAEWVVKFDSPHFDASHVRAFRRWLARSPDDRSAFEVASRAWNQLDLLSRLETYPLQAQEPVSVDRRALLIGAGAGAMAIAVGGYTLLRPSPAQAFETGVGEVRDIGLFNTARVTLDASTRIETQTRANNRLVRLIKGEALFSVASGQQGPLAITTPAGDIQVSEGVILIKLLPQGARLSVLSGAARVGSDTPDPSVGAMAIGPGSEILLGPGERLVTQVDGSLLSRRTLWREHRLAFDDTPLAEAVADVSRQTGARFVFVSPDLGDVRVEGLVDADDVTAFRAMLAQNVGVTSHQRADGAIELSRSPNAP